MNLEKKNKIKPTKTTNYLTLNKLKLDIFLFFVKISNYILINLKLKILFFLSFNSNQATQFYNKESLFLLLLL